jgi:hypothetical protein
MTVLTLNKRQEGNGRGPCLDTDATRHHRKLTSLGAGAAPILLVSLVLEITAGMER